MPRGSYYIISFQFYLADQSRPGSILGPLAAEEQVGEEMTVETGQMGRRGWSWAADWGWSWRYLKRAKESYDDEGQKEHGCNNIGE